ncbi:unnamed protein product [Lactuca saligna]|uniref:Uncharacterized protein n=1 Tax=Lactuca saligna TaxID=75948 RepID=A0AA35YV20_LACSI|nr:unnamed protein product [Lactuca saligna]
MLFVLLKQIPPQSWARSHFTGRAYRDALSNNPCEAFNIKLEEGRDAPIINCIEFIREYIMKKIVKVDKEIQKLLGPLTPTATTILDKIKIAIWDTRRNSVGIPESFVHPCYCLSRWKEMYSLKCSHWKTKEEENNINCGKEDFVRGNTTSRAHRSVTCKKCNNVVHNARTYKGQRPIVGVGGGQSKAKGKGNGKATT